MYEKRKQKWNKMSLRDKSTQIICAIGVGFMIITATILFIVSLINVGSDESTALISLILCFYLLFVAYLILYAAMPLEKAALKKCTWYSYFIMCLMPPCLVGHVLLWINDSFKNINIPSILRYIPLFFHVILAMIWYRRRLKGAEKNIVFETKASSSKKEYDVTEIDMMRLDMISTCALLPLTLIWIIYKIDFIKWEFAVFMGEFSIVQMFVKRILLRRKEYESLPIREKEAYFGEDNN